MVVGAMKDSACYFFTKPFEDGQFLSAVEQALVVDGKAKQDNLELADVTPHSQKRGKWVVLEVVHQSRVDNGRGIEDVIPDIGA